MEYTLRHIESNDWMTLVLIGILILITTARYLYPFRFQEFSLLLITDKYFNIQGKGYEIQHLFNVLLFAIQVLSISLFIYIVFQVFQPDIVEQSPWLFLQIITGFSIFILIKYIIEKIVGYIFEIESIINNYLYEKLSYTSLLSILLFIFNIVFLYAFTPSKMTIYITIAVVVVLFAISLVSSFKRNGNFIFKHFFYFILYLCALEIGPYLILYKLIKDFNA